MHFTHNAEQIAVTNCKDVLWYFTVYFVVFNLK